MYCNTVKYAARTVFDTVCSAALQSEDSITSNFVNLHSDVMGPLPDFCAVHTGRVFEGSCPDDGTTVSAWDVNGGSHVQFDNSSGVYTVPRDGLYAVYVQLEASSVSSGGKQLGGSSKKRKRSVSARDHVKFCVRLDEPASGSVVEDDIQNEFMDVGVQSFGEVLHLRKGASLSLLAMPESSDEILTFKIELVQRKRKPKREPDLTEKEKKKLEKKRKKLERRTADTKVPKVGLNDGTTRSAATTGDKCAEETSKVDAEEANGVVHTSAEDAAEDMEAGDGSWSADFTSDESGDEGAK